MYRKKAEPGEVSLAMAHAAKMQGAEFIMFAPEGIDLGNRRVRGLRFSDGDWVQAEDRFPDVVDNDDSLYRAGPEWAALTRDAPFTTSPLGGKQEIMKRMERAGFRPELQIPAAKVSSAQDILDFLGHHTSIVVKPARGSGGKGIVFIAADEQGFRVNLGNGDEACQRNDIVALHDRQFSDRPHVMQKFIPSRTLSGAPFDIRLHVRRDRAGLWKTVRIYARVGSGASIASNIGLGGAFAKSVTFLTHQFGPRAESVISRLRGLARTLPEEFQALYPDRVIDALGFDIGLDESGRPWIFEVNGFPGAQMFALEDAVHRVGYALHLARNATLAKEGAGA